MAGCLYECLQEAHLERYHNHFVHHGITKCDHLATLSMQDYFQFGITRMEDRVRLFKLVQIVKSVQAAGRFCNHEAMFGIGIVTNHQSKPQYTMQERPQTKGELFVQYLKYKSNGRTSGGVMSKPVTKPESVMAPIKKRRPQNDPVRFRPGTDSPIFKCRKMLTFSDSESEDEEMIKSPDAESITDSEIREKVFSTIPINSSKQKQKAERGSFPTSDPTAEINSKSLQQHQPIRITVHPPKSFFIDVGQSTHSKQLPNRETLFGLKSSKVWEEGPVGRLEKRSESPQNISSQKCIPQHYAIVNRNISAELLVQDKHKHSKLESSNNTDPAWHLELPLKSYPPDEVNIPKDTKLRKKEESIRNPTPLLLSSMKSITTASSYETTKESVQQFSDSQKAVSVGQQTQSIEISTGSMVEKSTQPINSIAYNPAKYSPLQPNAQSTNSSTSLKLSEPESSQIQSATAVAVPINIGIRSTESNKHTAPKSAVLRDARQRAMRGEDVGHAYFPISKPTPSPTKEPIVERKIHSTDYNYGVPSSLNSEKATPNKQKTLNVNNTQQRIRVCIRKRPLTRREQKRQEVDIVSTDGEDTIIVDETKVAINLAKYIQQHVYIFDEVFDEEKTNKDVYISTAKPLVKHIFNKGCATCFAFGQTGAGKTYTLLGTPSIPGLYRLAASDMFNYLQSGHYGSNLHLWVSYYEIYCSQLYDLLNKRKRLYVRENGRQRVCIAGLMETRVRNVDDVAQVVQYGNSVRSTGSTGVNPQSSRSHAILQLEIRDARDQRLGRMSFIDLAGSERASDVTEFDRQTRIEGAEINQSLLAALQVQADPQIKLKECIRSLDQDSRHTPYRQSKLTHILRDSFIGNSRTCMIANISPSLSACENTLNTLRYANRVKELRKSSPPSVATPSVGNETPVGHPEFAAPPFYPSNIQFSSTPKEHHHELRPRDLILKLQHDHSETPIRVQKTNRSPEKCKSTPQRIKRSPPSPLKISPFEFKVERNGVNLSIKTSTDTKVSPMAVSSENFGCNHSERKPSLQRESSLRSTSYDVQSPCSVYSQKQHPTIGDKISPYNNNVSTGLQAEYHQKSTNSCYIKKPISYEISHKPRDCEDNLMTPTKIDKLSRTDVKPNTTNGVSQVEKGHAEQRLSLQSRGSFVEEHELLLNHLDHIMDRAKAAIEESSSQETTPQKNLHLNSISSSADEKNHSYQKSNTSSRLSGVGERESKQKVEIVCQQNALLDDRNTARIKLTHLPEETIKHTFHELQPDSDTSEENWEIGVNEDEYNRHMPDGHHFSPNHDEESDSEDRLHSPLRNECLYESKEGDGQGNENSLSQITSDGNEYCSCHNNENIQTDQNNELPYSSNKADIEQKALVVKSNFRNSETITVSNMEMLEFNNRDGASCSSRTTSPLDDLHYSNHDISKNIDNIRQLLYVESPPNSRSGALPQPLLSVSTDESVSKLNICSSLIDQNKVGNTERPANEIVTNQQGNDATIPTIELLQSLEYLNIGNRSTTEHMELVDPRIKLSRVDPALARLGQSFKSSSKQVFQNSRGCSPSIRKSSLFQPYKSNKSERRELVEPCLARKQKSNNTWLNVGPKLEASDSGIGTQVEMKLSSVSEVDVQRDCDPDIEPDTVSSASTMDGIGSLSAQLEDETSQAYHLSYEKFTPRQSVEEINRKRGNMQTEQQDKLIKHHSLEEMTLSSLRDDQALKRAIPITRSISDIGQYSVQQMFAPIHPQPATSNSRRMITPVDLVPNKVISSEPAHETLEDAVKNKLVIDVPGEVLNRKVVPPISIPDDENTTHSSTGSACSYSSAVQRSQFHQKDTPTRRTLMLTAHEDQLSGITTLCKQEMHLLVAVRSGDKTFDDYIQATEDLLCSKAAAISTLRAQVSEFLQHPVLSSAANTPR